MFDELGVKDLMLAVGIINIVACLVVGVYFRAARKLALTAAVLFAAACIAGMQGYLYLGSVLVLATIPVLYLLGIQGMRQQEGQ